MISFAFAELERYLIRRGANTDTRYAHGRTRQLTDCEIARWTGRHRSTIHRLRTSGRVSIISAERTADHLGVDACEIWADYWDVMIDRQERITEYSQAYKRWRDDPQRYPHPSALRRDEAA